MPCLRIQSNQSVENKEDFIKKASKTAAAELGKDESYMMVIFEPEVDISFGGSFEPSVFMELKSIGLPESVTGEVAAALCNLAEEELGVSQDRVYINFINFEGPMWGWNGQTFG